MKLIQELKLTSYLHDKHGKRDEGVAFDVGMWHSKENICEFDDERCLNYNGLYFGTMDEREPKFCPTHFFTGDTGYVLEPNNQDDILCEGCGQSLADGQSIIQGESRHGVCS